MNSREINIIIFTHLFLFLASPTDRRTKYLKNICSYMRVMSSSQKKNQTSILIGGLENLKSMKLLVKNELILCKQGLHDLQGGKLKKNLDELTDTGGYSADIHCQWSCKINRITKPL